MYDTAVTTAVFYIIYRQNAASPYLEKIMEHPIPYEEIIMHTEVSNIYPGFFHFQSGFVQQYAGNFLAGGGTRTHAQGNAVCERHA